MGETGKIVAVTNTFWSQLSSQLSDLRTPVNLVLLVVAIGGIIFFYKHYSHSSAADAKHITRGNDNPSNPGNGGNTRDGDFDPKELLTLESLKETMTRNFKKTNLRRLKVSADQAAAIEAMDRRLKRVEEWKACCDAARSVIRNSNA